MSTWWAWVAGPQGTTVLALCALVLGMILGYLTGHRSGWRAALADLRERREEARAERWVRRVREPGPAIYVPQDYALAAAEAFKRAELEVAHEREPAHVGAALALASDDPTVSAWTADMAASMDRWLAEHVYGVPYSADELWSGQ